VRKRELHVVANDSFQYNGAGLTVVNFDRLINENQTVAAMLLQAMSREVNHNGVTSTKALGKAAELVSKRRRGGVQQ
jgi:hypothetical protein